MNDTTTVDPYSDLLCLMCGQVSDTEDETCSVCDEVARRAPDAEVVVLADWRRRRGELKSKDTLTWKGEQSGKE